MNKLGVARLSCLAEFLKTLHPSKFNISSWVTGSNPETMAEEPTQAGECGTTACAAGWLPLLYPKSWEWTRAVPPSSSHRRSLSYVGGRASAIYLAQGLEHFFSLDSKQVYKIFYGQSYRYSPEVTPKMVVRRIRAVLKKEAA